MLHFGAALLAHQAINETPNEALSVTNIGQRVGFK